MSKIIVTGSDGRFGKILKDLNNNGQTIIIITHEDNIANQSNRIIKIKDPSEKK